MMNDTAGRNVSYYFSALVFQEEEDDRQKNEKKQTNKQTNKQIKQKNENKQ